MSGKALNRGYVIQSGDMLGKQLIVDSYPLIIKESKVVTESVNGRERKVFKFGGQCQKGDALNENMRIYPTSVLKEAVDNIQSDIKARAVLGELDHPSDAKIHLDRVSHLLTKMWVDKNGTVFCEGEILEGTIHGKQLKALFEAGVRVSVSSRGVGDMEETMVEGKECSRVLPGYSFLTVDIVQVPSVSGSHMSLKESMEKKKSRIIDVRKLYEEKLLREIKGLFD